MAFAAERGHEHIVRLCKEEYGAKKFKNAIARARSAGYLCIVHLLQQWDAS